ncbi:signal transduction histidine kinase, nitrogen specific [Owenweeksia hongkongensis DSM 17368]|uniref:histidine kinase n=1 Tax=Owenweeksia hongkongensis (strain DSM 17368 / CIP 108786 / JCM 12287 / NRRL B-23963 / UST20020801) TaxID=926562 RepID=G8R2F7_OWEHD|nr:HAMP domain-containing sensor histidine kinase [Owenweeksia hongkongensis]AEV32947.1 signal transduction histidine kinase, nitrogen specific [Owenweeksia hongkongensis DSM 17368]
MDFYGKKNLWKFILFMFAVLIGAATLWYTESFLDELRDQEVIKVKQFGLAMSNIILAENNSNIIFEQEFIQSNNTIPIIIVNEGGGVVMSRNVDLQKSKDPKWLANKMAEMEAEFTPIEIKVSDEITQYLYYQNSILLTKLRYYPFVLLGVISLFIIIAYIAFSNARKSEQNQVWNGLAKETAHQIGTPLSSLMGWMELLRAKETEQVMVEEMEKDINRLNTITDRFSKIGSKPSISNQDIVAITEESVSYLKARSPRKVEVIFNAEEAGASALSVKLNKPLYEWVIENLVRNAIDALEGAGKIEVRISDMGKRVKIEVEDNGKGIPVNKQKTIFRPGFTTKSRGWGLGLSLAKRIIEEYHGGKIFVAQSDPGRATIFRILLDKET